MSDHRCPSLDDLVPKLMKNRSKTNIADDLKNYREELHHELTKHWPCREKSSNVEKTSSPEKNTDDQQKIIGSNVSKIENSTKSNRTTKIPSEFFSTSNELALKINQQKARWDNIDTQEGIITYSLPDGLADGVLLQNKLQTIRKSIEEPTKSNGKPSRRDVRQLSDEDFKENFFREMKRLRQSQQKYEEELVSKGILPHTTDEEIRILAEQRRQQRATDANTMENVNQKISLFDAEPSEKIPSGSSTVAEELFETFDTDNVHPEFHRILSNYQFQTKFGEETNGNFEKSLRDKQTKIKSIFPRINERDLIRKQLQSVKTSEGLYAHSNRPLKSMNNEKS